MPNVLTDSLAFAIFATPLIVGLVEIIKQAGLPGRFAPLLDLGLGLAFCVARALVLPNPVPADLLVAVFAGLLLGEAAAGVYDSPDKLRALFSKDAPVTPAP